MAFVAGDAAPTAAGAATRVSAAVEDIPPADPIRPGSFPSSSRNS